MATAGREVRHGAVPLTASRLPPRLPTPGGPGGGPTRPNAPKRPRGQPSAGRSPSSPPALVQSPARSMSLQTVPPSHSGGNPSFCAPGRAPGLCLASPRGLESLSALRPWSFCASTGMSGARSPAHVWGCPEDAPRSEPLGPRFEGV